jgi:hypothetical protein
MKLNPVIFYYLQEIKDLHSQRDFNKDTKRWANMWKNFHIMTKFFVVIFINGKML